MAFKKCPNGMYSEIKYDGERVQLHKRGDEFKYYSRSLKPVLPHKVSCDHDQLMHGDLVDYFLQNLALCCLWRE